MSLLEVHYDFEGAPGEYSSIDVMLDGESVHYSLDEAVTFVLPEANMCMDMCMDMCA